MKARLLSAAALVAASTTAAAGGAGEAPTNAELYEIIQAQQSQIEDLQGQPTGGFGNRTSIGGYGELHYNNIKDGDDEIDFHRFVLFINHEFNDRIRLFTELELEHALAGDGAEGEVELEQAYIEFDLNDKLQAKGGLFLVPVGILNETHEPPTFYGVERNNVESRIIPSTWWEAGAALNGRNDDGLSWDVALHSGLELEATDSSIRSGRQKVAEAIGNDPAVTGRLRYTGVAGLDLAATVQYQSDITQSRETEEASATLLQAHAIYQTGGTKLTAFYATWDIDNAAFETEGSDEQTGYYLEASQKVSEQVGVFVRHENWDNRAGNATDTENDQQTLGVNYWPHENVVIKADIFNREETGGTTETEGFNLGIGYQF
ncbi:MAG: porin [Gammaproteobacteria bacterium]|nr:porin [Gammaproteobacteria bacterium]